MFPSANTERQGEKLTYLLISRGASHQLFWYTSPKSKREINCENIFCLTPAGTQHLPRFQGARLNPVQGESSFRRFPREFVSFDPWHVLPENLFELGGITMLYHKRACDTRKYSLKFSLSFFPSSHFQNDPVRENLIKIKSVILYLFQLS